jgi:catechol 2,3-dioxygenase-like lactoylglutathione lyase family enzyme
MSRVFGPIRQNGYVVRDLEGAMRHWTEVLGVGPFFHFATAPLTGFRLRGTPSPATCSIALANSGPLQIELIQPHGDAPSMWHEFLAAGHEGLQHVAFWTERFDDALAAATAAGHVVEQSGCSGGPDGRFVYFRDGAHPGAVIELSEVSGAKGRFFAMVAEAARTWDGGDPIRRL